MLVICDSVLFVSLIFLVFFFIVYISCSLDKIRGIYLRRLFIDILFKEVIKIKFILMLEF